MKLTNYALFLSAASLLTSLGNAQNLRQLKPERNTAAVGGGGGEAASTDEDLEGVPRAKARAHQKRQQLKAYFQEQRRKMQVVATTVTESGQIIDWIDPQMQLAEGETLATPPPPTVPRAKSGAAKAQQQFQDDVVSPDDIFELRRQPHAMGPEGTVPVLRSDTIAANMKDDDLPDTVDDFLSKYGKKSDIPQQHLHKRKNRNGRHERNSTDAHAGSQHRQLQSGAQHKYVSVTETVSNFGGEAYINTWDSYVWKNGEFSLAQVAVISGSKVTQTVECGWQEYPGLYGDSYPHLFIFYTTNGYASQKDYEGGYNRDVAGFVQVSKTIFPGARITGSVPLSSYFGKQYSMQVKVKLYQGNWWVGVFGQWIGYYPATLFAGQAGGLQYGAANINWYGEIIDATDGSPTRTWMGSGQFASKGYGNAAYIRNILTYRTDCNCAANYSPQYNIVTNSKCYSYAPKFNSGTSWGSYFYFGGPGAYNNNQCSQE